MADDAKKLTTAQYQARIDRIPYARFLGIRVEADGAGRFLTRLCFSERLIGNPILPAIHGGVLGALLETAAIFQLVWAGEANGNPKTIDFNIDYLRSARAQDALARATITKHGRRVANVRVEAWQDDPERPVAAGHGHFLLPNPEK